MSNDTSHQTTHLETQVLIRIPPNLRSLTGELDEVIIRAATIRAAFTALEEEFPGLYDRIFDQEGRLRRFVLLALNDDFLDPEQELNAELRAGDQISILPALAGG